MAGRIITDPEGFLLDVLREASELVWQRYNARYIHRFINGKIIPTEKNLEPPYVAFRFKNESEKLIEKLKELVMSYQGTIKWEMYGRKRYGSLPGFNWVIRPLKVSEAEFDSRQIGLSPEQYLAEREPKFSDIAFEDLNGLTKYIEKNLIDFVP